MQLRDYQAKALHDIEQILSVKNDAVLASCPSSGKTLMAIEFIKRHKGSFLVITHGQNILKNMWQRELESNLSKEDQSRVIYGLPQSLRNSEIPEVDYIIIDEAHEFTFASMVQNILKKNGGAKKLYLTGTPSKFIEKKYDVVIIPAIELIDQGYISDLYIGLCSTKADIKDKDRNRDEDVGIDSYCKLEKTVDEDLDSLLESITKRLSSIGVIKDRPYISKMSSWAPVLSEIDKTMIACASVKQAEKVLKYFKKQNINAISSNSIDDPESLNISKFMEDQSIKILIVVDRAILGFNMESLINVVDMTCSHNINRIYQLYARVMRKNEKESRKYFFKLAVDNEMQVTKFYMEAALCLMYGYFISKYNGKNLNTIEIPVKIKSNRGSKKEHSNSKKPTTSRSISVDEDIFETVSSAKLMNDIFNKVGQDLNEYAMVTFKEIKRDVFNKKDMLEWSTPESLWKSMLESGIVDAKFYRV